MCALTPINVVIDAFSSMKIYGNYMFLFYYDIIWICLSQVHESLNHFKEDEIDNHLGKLYIEWKSLHLAPKSTPAKHNAGEWAKEMKLHCSKTTVWGSEKKQVRW